jgi:hypothetical protein
MSKPTSYAEAPQEIKDAVEQLIETYSHNPALLAGAIVAATYSAIMAAEKRGAEREREACAAVADDGVFDEHALAQATDVGLGKDIASREIAAAIRKRGA